MGSFLGVIIYQLLNFIIDAYHLGMIALPVKIILFFFIFLVIIFLGFSVLKKNKIFQQKINQEKTSNLSTENLELELEATKQELNFYKNLVKEKDPEANSDQ